MRLIDADALKDRLAKHQSILDFEWHYDGLIVSIIDNVPTIEPFEKIGAICNENCGYRPQGEPDINDLISREALKNDIVENHYFGMFTENVLEVIDNVPAVAESCKELQKVATERPHIIDNCDMNVFEPEKYMEGGE